MPTRDACRGSRAAGSDTIMINTTPICRCGGEKKENRQWCGPCWDSIPVWKKNEFIQASGRMKYTINLAELALEERQPSL